MKKTVFTGAGVALVTPFNRKGEVDFRKLKELIDFQIDNGTDAIIVCGTTGENATLSDEEHLAVIKTAVEYIDSRVPVIAGTGSNDSAHAVKISNEAERYGVNALLVVTPYYNKTSQHGLIKHYEFISNNVSTPMIVYNVPSRTGVNIQPQIYKELAEIKNIVGTKEANGDISALIKTMSLCGNDFDIYSGNDDQIAPICALGGKGVISVMSNIAPKVVHDIALYAIEGNVKKSAALQKHYQSLCDALFSDVNPVPVKTAMNMLNMDVGKVRLPLYEMTEKKKDALRQVLSQYNLI